MKAALFLWNFVVLGFHSDDSPSAAKKWSGVYRSTGDHSELQIDQWDDHGLAITIKDLTINESSQVTAGFLANINEHSPNVAVAKIRHTEECHIELRLKSHGTELLDACSGTETLTYFRKLEKERSK